VFLRNPENMKLVTREVNPDAAWVLEGIGMPTIKKDGTNVRVTVRRVTVRNGVVVYAEKRRNPTREEKANGAEPGYVPVDERDPSDKHILRAIIETNYSDWPDGEWSCEALGPKIQGGVESSTPCLYCFSLFPTPLPSWENPRTWLEMYNCLEAHEIEGIVWHDKENHRYAKIKRRDFGLPWPVKK